MTGPQHYAAAEALLSLAEEATHKPEPDYPRIAEMTARAQVHATLAHAAAVAETGRDSDGDTLIPPPRSLGDVAWSDVAGYPSPEPRSPAPDRTVPGEPGPLIEAARAIMERRGDDLSDPIPNARLNDARVVLHVAARWLGERRRGDVGSLLIREAP